MTLVLTELSDAGIVMVADSAIAQMTADGKIAAAYKQWPKLLRVSVPPDLRAGVSYWGVIGKVTKQDFPEWLKLRLSQTEEFHDLRSLAEYLARELNAACGNKPLSEGCDVGLHVAGFSPWLDGKLRATVFHVHNRHSQLGTRTLLYDVRNQPARRQRVLKAGPMGLFEARQNFPELTLSVPENVSRLEAGEFLLRNGDYGPYAVVSTRLYEAFAELNGIDGCRIPRDPKNIASRMGFHRMMIETMIRIYASSNLPKLIGKPVQSLGIDPGKYVTGTDAP